MGTLTNKDIDSLIKIGKCNPAEAKKEINLMDYIKNRDIINTLHSTEWQSKIASHSDSDIVHLFKGLVLTERELHWVGGSVAAAIWVYRTIQERSLDEDNHIAAFAVKYSYNTLVPFGWSRVLFGWESAHLRPERIRARNSPNRSCNLAREKREKIRSQGRREIEIAKLRELSYEERNKTREKLLKKYISFSVVEKLEMIVNDKQYPPEYYPYEWVLVSDDEIQKLPIELLKRLNDKLSRKTKGEWKRFAKKLKKYDDGT